MPAKPCACGEAHQHSSSHLPSSHLAVAKWKSTSAAYLAAETSAWSAGTCGPAASASSAPSCGSGWACCYCPQGWQTTGSVGSKHKVWDAKQSPLCHGFITTLGL